MVLVDGAGTPLGADLDAASPAEVRLLEATLDTVMGGQPERLIADRGYDSHAVRALLAQRGIEPIIPARVPTHRPRIRMAGNCGATVAAGSSSARLAGLGHFRRLTVRYDRLLETYGGFFHLACAIVTLRKILK